MNVPSTAVKPDFVYSLHGFRTQALWKSIIEHEIASSTLFPARGRNYLRFGTMKFIMKSIFADKPLRLIETELQTLQQNHRVSVIAHSFGSWLIQRALEHNPNIVIHNLILCGAITPRGSSLWRQLKCNRNQITGDIINFSGLQDPWPALAELFSRDFGASGVLGAGDPFVIDSFHDVSHNGFLTREFCRSFWTPILQGKSFQPGPMPPCGPPRYIRAILWVASHRLIFFALLLAALLGGYYAWQSEWSCYVRSCFVNLVRIHDYTSSTRQPGPRRYVSRISFEYTFNYNRDNVRFRSPKDLYPRVISLLGSRLGPIQGYEASETLRTCDNVETRRWHIFDIPVRDRRAYFTVEFSNDRDEPPTGISAFADVAINDFRGQILLQDDVSLVSVRDDAFSGGITIDGLLQNSTRMAKLCKFDDDGKAFLCSGLNIPPNQEFRYYFGTKGWRAADEIHVPTIATCGKIKARKTQE
jgi:pimeloyl-ACP methyl ester carboxylesterase